MQLNDKNQGYSDAQIRAMKKELFEGPDRNLHALESNPSFQHGQAILQLKMDNVIPQADQSLMPKTPKKSPSLTNYGGQMLEDWMDIDVSKMGVGQNSNSMANAEADTAMQSDTYQNPSSNTQNKRNSFDRYAYIEEEKRFNENLGKAVIKPIRDSIGDYRDVALMRVKHKYPYEQEEIDNYVRQGNISHLAWMLSSPQLRPLFYRVLDQMQNGEAGYERNMAHHQAVLDDAQSRLDQFKDDTDKKYTPDQDFQESVADFVGTTVGETVRNIGGLVMTPIAGTPTMNKVMSEQIPAFQKRGLSFDNAYDRAFWNGATDIRNIIDLPIADKFSKVGKGALAVGKFGFKHLDDASKAAIRRYGDDMNPAFLIDEGATYLKNTPIIKKADRLLDRSQQYLQDGWNKVTNSPMGREAIDAVPEGLKDARLSHLVSYGEDLLSTATEDAFSKYSENTRQQEIGKDVSAFNETHPDFETLKKSIIDTTIKDDLWNWWEVFRK